MEEIKSEFKRSGFGLEDEQEILSKCVTFCINYSLTPSDLVSIWEVYYLNKQLNEPIVQNAEIDGFLLHLQNEQKEDVIKENEEAGLHIYSIGDVEIGEEISRTAADGKPMDRLSRLANHILNQQSFYPLYPPAEGVPLDFSLAPEALQLSSIPDILILPSDIKYFVKLSAMHK